VAALPGTKPGGNPSAVAAFARRDGPTGDGVLQGLTTAVVVLAPDLKVVYLNAAAEALLGTSRRQALGRDVAELVLPAEELVGLCHRVLQSGLTYGCRELQARVADREVILDCRAGLVDDYSDYLLLELFDTQRDRQLRREEELRAQQRLSRRIIRQLAHEVKNPLGGLRGAAQLLERQLPNAEMKAYTRVIIDEADRLAALVDGILRAGGQPRLSSVNLHEVTEHVGHLIEAEKPADVTLVRDYDPSLPRTVVDRDQLIQAVLNVARNAMQAVDSRNGRLILRTRALINHTLAGKKHRLVLSIEIEDNGPGISKELANTIFYPLVTGKPTGTGLGLTIAQDLVSRNGGLIEFTTSPGATTFFIRLPLSDGGPEAKPR
jgi:two-component system nitrogen regulation sensor histidine kinase GlnL